jgi:hypothetical protein
MLGTFVIFIISINLYVLLFILGKDYNLKMIMSMSNIISDVRTMIVLVSSGV